jgi:inner membrane protein
MDSITHIALGACMGEVFAGKQLGKKAMLWGAMAQSIPDIDFINSFWMDTPSSLLAHRGFTHSLLFCVLITPLFALTAAYWHRPHNIKLFKWMIFFGAVILTHIFLDAFNNYGVGWFEPFDHTRISFNVIYVADPFFSILPGIALIALLILRRSSPARKKWGRFGLGFALFYLSYCLVNKMVINAEVTEILKQKKIKYSRYFTTPAPLQNWLWFVVAGDDKGYYVGYRSVFDSQTEIDFQYFPCNDSLLDPVRDDKDCQQLIRFSQQFYTAENKGDTLVFNDLRFGQVAGWYDPHEQFVFHYYLDQPGGNSLVVQRGRFAKWNWKVVSSFISRIRGN